ncbi:MAG: periplasmic heavy metal sensor [Alphaproteobacteria bacterium]|nr:periplasmic heavy metal sensor [Alphaproteobacteria bacterium]
MKLPFYAATALISVLLLAGTAGAQTMPVKAPPPAASAEQQKPAQPGKPCLSDEKNKILKAALAKAREDNQQITEQIKAKRKELAALMGAERFDKEAFLAKDAEMQDLIAKAARKKAEALASVAGQFAVQDRKILAERFGKRKGSRSGHGMNKASGGTGK